MRPIDKIAARVRKCRRCRLWKGRKHAVPGEGPCPAKIMLIGQAPGRNEDETGRPFVGRAGKFLDKMLKHARIDRKKAYITSVVKCFPPRNRVPRIDAIESCNQYLKEQIRLVQPKTVILLGNISIKTVLRTQDPRLGTNHGKFVKRNGILFLLTYHPAAGMRFPTIRKQMIADFLQIKRHLP